MYVARERAHSLGIKKCLTVNGYTSHECCVLWNKVSLSRKTYNRELAQALIIAAR